MEKDIAIGMFQKPTEAEDLFSFGLTVFFYPASNLYVIPDEKRYQELHKDIYGEMGVCIFFSFPLPITQHFKYICAYLQ